MASTFTPNVQIEEPARGDDSGTWDTPVNGNMTLLDLLVGGITTISGAAGSVVLSAAQFQCKTITVNSTLTASITLTFPTSFKKSYEIQNAATGSSQFIITLTTTATGGQAICVPPGGTSECFTDGTNVKFKNLPYVGSFWDFAGSSVPAWVSGCTVPPWVNCDGSAVSSGTYPALFGLMTTLPDARGRARAALNQGTGRMTSANGGVDGNTNSAGGGADSVTLTTNQIPAHSHGVTDPGHSHVFALNNYISNGNFVIGGISASDFTFTTNAAATGISIQNSGGGLLHTNMQPTYVGGITMIRAG